jgi:hypothetical protein
MIAKADFKLEWGFVDRTKLAIKHFHFHIEGPDEQHIYFYTHVDALVFSSDTLSTPLDYILFGSLLLIFRNEIKEEIKKHSTDEISVFFDNMKKEEENRQ